MPDYTKQTQTGTDKSGQPIYSTASAWYKQKRKRRRKTRKKAARRTGATPSALLMGAMV
jgi:hypothetical protein